MRIGIDANQPLDAAQSAGYSDGRHRAIRPSPVGPDQFGEKIDFQRGGFSLRVTDVSLPGHFALPVKSSARSCATPRPARCADRRPEINLRDGALGDWTIELPNIGGVFPQQKGRVNGNAESPARCSSFTQGAGLSVDSSDGFGGSGLYPNKYSSGKRQYNYSIPDTDLAGCRKQPAGTSPARGKTESLRLAHRKATGFSV